MFGMKKEPDAQKRLGLQLATFIGGGIGVMWGFFLARGVGMVVVGVIMAVLSRVVVSLILKGSSDAVMSFILPDDRGGAGVGYSHIETLEVRGDIAGALAAWEKVIADTPDALAARITAAELYSRRSDNHRRAEQLYRSVQSHAKAPDETKRYVTQRLIDLYLGPLKDEGRALVELRRVANRWPDSPEGKGARQAIANIKNL
jgi:hypothetical protein